MMRDTPRTFVGTVVLPLEGPVAPESVAGLCDGRELMPGVRVAELDLTTGTLMVTAERPADRADVVAVLASLRCHVCH
jgi:hypothetical protein